MHQIYFKSNERSSVKRLNRCIRLLITFWSRPAWRSGTKNFSI